MGFVFHFEVLPRRRRDLPPGAGPPVSTWPATTACPPSDTVTCWTMTRCVPPNMIRGLLAEFGIDIPKGITTALAFRHDARH